MDASLPEHILNFRARYLPRGRCGRSQALRYGFCVARINAVHRIMNAAKGFLIRREYILELAQDMYQAILLARR